MPIDAVVFDMDGILVDSEVYWRECREAFARDRGLIWTAEDQHHAMGRNTLEWAQVMRERLKLDLSPEAIAEEMIQRVQARYEARLPLLPGALEAVHAVAGRYRMALASGSPPPIIRFVIDRAELQDVFEAVIYGEEMSHGKPAPDIYLETLRQLDLPPSQAVGIEDSANGVRALKAAGMIAVAVPSPGFSLPDDVLALADRVLDSMVQLSVAVIDGLDHG
jgi:HAD superfamily hydrolase (TIGR01509 family)